jgi:hypothetical protein
MRGDRSFAGRSLESVRTVIGRACVLSDVPKPFFRSNSVTLAALNNPPPLSDKLQRHPWFTR